MEDDRNKFIRVFNVEYCNVEVTTSRKTLHLYLCISVTSRLLLPRNILNEEQCILLYP